MGDDRYCYLHCSDSLVNHLLDEADETLGWDLPQDDVIVAQHLLPPYQDEDDESILPSASHPSYPYGNPHALAISTHSTLPTTLFSSSPSLATTLPVLSLPHLFTITAFGQPKERVWSELGLNSLLPEEERQIEIGVGDGLGSGSEAPQPTGQNAGDHPPNEEDLTGIGEMEE